MLSDDIVLLGLILRNDREAVKAYLENVNLSHDEFKNFADDNRLSGTLYAAINGPEYKDIFPEHLIAHFKSAYMNQWVINQLLIKATERLSELFRSAGVDIISLKGPVLAQRFYGDVAQRAVGDIDILIKNEDLNDSIWLLKENGFGLASRILFSKKSTSYFTHHFEYLKKDTKLELHWALDTHFSFNIDYNRIWREKEEFAFDNRRFFVLSGEYEIVLQILSIFKDIQLGTIAMKSFVDIYMILKATNKSVKWEEFFLARREEGIYAISINILDLVLSLFNCGDEFMELSRYMEKNGDDIKFKDLAKQLQLLKHSKIAVKKRLWALSLYDAGLAGSVFWWGASLPFRLMVYKKS